MKKSSGPTHTKVQEVAGHYNPKTGQANITAPSKLRKSVRSHLTPTVKTYKLYSLGKPPATATFGTKLLSYDKLKEYAELLKPCPFCGNTPNIEQGATGSFFAICPTEHCWANNENNIQASPNMNIVISRWNRRNPSPEDEEFSQYDYLKFDLPPEHVMILFEEMATFIQYGEHNQAWVDYINKLDKENKYILDIMTKTWKKIEDHVKLHKN